MTSQAGVIGTLEIAGGVPVGCAAWRSRNQRWWGEALPSYFRFSDPGHVVPAASGASPHRAEILAGREDSDGWQCRAHVREAPREAPLALAGVAA